MTTLRDFRRQAVFLRESTGSALERTLIKAVQVLALFDIPHLVCGGFAVQERGYPRFTVDVDIIVPDVAHAREKLSMNGFRPNAGSSMTVTDRETKIEIDLLPGGGSVGPGPLKLPMPTRVSTRPIIMTLPELITQKLSSYMGSPGRRLQDAADVTHLIRVNKLPRTYPLLSEVRQTYQTLWDSLHQ